MPDDEKVLEEAEDFAMRKSAQANTELSFGRSPIGASGGAGFGVGLCGACAQDRHHACARKTTQGAKCNCGCR